MERDEMVLNVMKHWICSDVVTRNAIFRYIVEIVDDDDLGSIERFVTMIV